LSPGRLREQHGKHSKAKAQLYVSAIQWLASWAEAGCS
jgi:hypothetical protein